MTAARALLHRLANARVVLEAKGDDRLGYRGPKRAVTREVLTELRERKSELLELLRSTAHRALRPGRDGTATELLERFLTDAELPLAILHSRALGRDFAIARSAEAVELLAESERSLPVLFTADCHHFATLGLEGLRVLLDLRAEFGPEVKLRSVEAMGAAR